MPTPGPSPAHEYALALPASPAASPGLELVPSHEPDMDPDAFDTYVAFLHTMAAGAKSCAKQCRTVVEHMEPLKDHIAAGGVAVRSAISMAVGGTFEALSVHQERDHSLRQLQAGEPFAQHVMRANALVEQAHQAARTEDSAEDEAEPAEVSRAEATARAYVEDLEALRNRSPQDVIALSEEAASAALDQARQLPVDVPATTVAVLDNAEDAERFKSACCTFVQTVLDAARIAERRGLQPPPELRAGVGQEGGDVGENVRVALRRGTYEGKAVHVALVRGWAEVGAGLHRLAHERCPGSVAAIRACKLSETRSKMVLDRAEGTLREVALPHDGGLQDVARGLRLVIQLVDATGNLHARHIFVRGLNCDTVLVYREEHQAAGDGLRAKVADFSGSKVTQCASVRTASANCETLGAGTRWEDPFRAPELRRARTTTPEGLAAADVFSLGCIASSVISGRAPRAESGAAQVRAFDPSTVSFDRSIANELHRIVRSCLYADPSQRPGTAGLREGLARCFVQLTGQPAPPQLNETGVRVPVAVAMGATEA